MASVFFTKSLRSLETLNASRSFSMYKPKYMKKKPERLPGQHKIPEHRGLIQYVPKKTLKKPSPHVLELPQHEEKAKKFKTPWKLMTSTMIGLLFFLSFPVSDIFADRLPVVMKAPEKWEQDMWDLQDRKDEETLLDFPYEVLFGEDPVLKDPIEDPEWRSIGGFALASRTTEADASGDMKTHDRKLDSRLYLIVKKSRDEHSWQFPQVHIKLHLLVSWPYVYISIFRVRGKAMRQCVSVLRGRC